MARCRRSLDRNAAAFADIAGWAAVPAGRTSRRAETRLAEAARLYRNVDATNQMHLGGIVAAARTSPKPRGSITSRRSASPASHPPQREQARTALADVQAKSGESPAEFEKWLTDTLDAPARGTPQGAGQRHGRQAAAGAGAHRSAGQQDRPARGARQRRPAEFFLSLVRGLSGGVAAHPEGLREIPGAAGGEVHPRQPR